MGEVVRDYRVRITTMHRQDDDVGGTSSSGVGHIDRPNSCRVEERHRTRITQSLAVLTTANKHDTRTTTRTLLCR